MTNVGWFGQGFFTKTLFIPLSGRLFMKRLALATTLLVVLVSAVTLSSSVVGVAEAAASGVYINADGSVQGTTSIQRIEELYTFTGDFAGPLYFQRDNIVVDGTGYTHFRKDFPKTDDQKWKGNIFLKKSGDGMSLAFRPLAESV